MKIPQMLGVATVLLFSTPVLADCAPSGMVFIVSSNQTPGLPEASFARLPKIQYRSGSRYARIEEALDKSSNTQLLAVISTPDVWMANLADGTGQHRVDPDPKSRVRSIIFDAHEMGATFPPAFTDLEMGCEIEFFETLKAEKIPHLANGKSLMKHVLNRGAWRLTLLTSANGPEMLMLSKDGKVAFALRYHEYIRFPKIDPSLFRRPANIEFADAAR